MFQYEYEKRPPSANSCDSGATVKTDWSRVFPTVTRAATASSRASSARYVTASADRARRPLPPRPIVCDRIPTKPTVPLRVWIIASASCFAVCAALVLATVAITKWGTTDAYTEREMYTEAEEPKYSHPKAKPFELPSTEANPTTTDDIKVSENLPVFKNIVRIRDRSKKNDTKQQDLSLISKPQMHPLHENIDHEARNIAKKDQAINFDDEEILDIAADEIPDFRPTLPDFFIKNHEIKLPDGYIKGLRKLEEDTYEEYYNDENLYEDYMQSNTMTSYLIEKIQELHDWITSDPDFKVPNRTTNNYFSQLLKALNESLVEGNVSIVMNKLKDIYFSDFNNTTGNGRKVILTNNTDLLSFGILTLDVMLLHNIQLMAWESQESIRNKMLKDPDVFAFNALFLDPTKVEAKQNEINHQADKSMKRQSAKSNEFDVEKGFLENVLDIGMSTARAAIHLGRAYKNTKMVVNHLQNKETLNANIHTQLSRNIDGNTHALNHLQSSFDESSSVSSSTNMYTELDCVWMLYCKNLAVTSKLNPPYGTMARINGMALRMLAGELSADKALDTMLYEAFTGWTDLKCNDMFPKCAKVNAAAVVMESILQPLRKSHSSNKAR